MQSSTGRLEGKVAIITGGARGQGEAHTRRFVAEGARVMVTDVLDVAPVVDDLGEAALGCYHDVSDEGAWADVVDTTVDEFGRVDVLVNNAGIHHVVPIEEETLAGWQRILDVNLKGTFLGIRSVIAAMRDAGGGAIVNGSWRAGMKGTPGPGAYGASKWGVRGLTKTAALELGPSTIRVNSVPPGPIDPDMLPGRDTGRYDNYTGTPLQ